MIGFMTQNSTYYVDQSNRTITGGRLGNGIYRYIRMTAIIGRRAVVVLENGSVMTTGIVKCYI